MSFTESSGNVFSVSAESPARITASAFGSKEEATEDSQNRGFALS
jgi:hypothetical protein